MRPLLLAAAVLLAAAPALAQQARPGPDDAAVTFTLRTTIGDSDAPVPSVLTSLADDPHLARLDVSSLLSPSSEPQPVEAVFVFRGVAAYREWRESDRVVSLLTELEAGSTRGVQTAVQLRRLPLDDEG